MAALLTGAGFNEQSCSGPVRIYQGNSSALGGWRDKERGMGRAESRRGRCVCSSLMAPWLTGSLSAVPPKSGTGSA